MIAKGLRLASVPLIVTIAFGLWGHLGSAPGALIPDNLGLNARPEAIGSRFEAFAALPLAALLITSILAVAPLIGSGRGGLRRSETAFLTTWLSLLGFCALIQGGITLRSLGLWQGDDYGPLLPLWAVGFSALIAAVGNVLGKARPNWFIGIRTPWTMRSEWTWDRTHRFAGRLFVATGLVCLLVAVVSSANEAMVALTFGVAGAAIASAVYSYCIWLRAPDRAPGGRG